MELHKMIARRVMINVARIRKEKDLSQYGLAAKTKISRAYLTQLEGGSRDPSLEMVCRFAEALGVQVEQLIKAQ